MKKIILVLIAGAAGYGLLSYHFIVFDNSLKIIKKTGIRNENTFVDARGAKKLGIALKPDLIAAGINDVLEQINGSSRKHKDSNITPKK
jgi:hypothetical protein